MTQDNELDYWESIGELKDLQYLLAEDGMIRQAATLQRTIIRLSDRSKKLFPPVKTT